MSYMAWYIQAKIKLTVFGISAIKNYALTRTVAPSEVLDIDQKVIHLYDGSGNIE
jgi:hypothetical protein